MIILTALAVICRIYVRVTHRQALQGSDWLCLASLALFYGQCGFFIHFILRYGAFELGPPLEPSDIIKLLKITWIGTILFGALITTVKLSILWFYHSIFSINLRFKCVIIAVAAACIVWFIVNTSISIFQCHPIDAFWNQFGQAEFCPYTLTFFLGYEITNLFLDVAILCIPLGVLRQLNLPPSKRIPLCLVFILGGLVCVASIVRLTAIWKLPNPALDLNISITILAGTIQAGLAIICSCLPVLGPIFSSLSKALDIIRTWYATLLSYTSRGMTLRGSRSKHSAAGNVVHGWAKVEGPRDPVIAGSWARADQENRSDTFPLNSMESGGVS
ncbi:hypothetical protein F4819DRAFT_504675 [Hypoxylon fuscum]|nr:hypothetical protein F4819DRAFT_504675 [Hypoxylon fuscum]